MLRIELPWPDAALNPNRSKGTHWGQSSAKRAKRHADARLLALQAMRAAGYTPPAGELAVRITLEQPDRRRRDRDNLLASLKHDLDGISVALGRDDEDFNPLTVCRTFGGKPGRVIVEIGVA